MSTVVGIAGSLRDGSYNARLLRAAADYAPPGVVIEIASIAEIPLYNGDREREHGLPDSVSVLKERVVRADGILLVTPEYNNSLPGVLKNAIDWLSRPPDDISRVFGGKPVALVGATPGRGGTRLAQAAWLPVLRTLGTRPYFGKQLYVAGASRVFGDSGLIEDDAVRDLLIELLTGFRDFISAR